ncbi:hypothetical protein [Streptomyces atratus]|uniref:hypothetical protein n=1 Tax=Streptomyces atratus TaxID=1893 RepID=UPI0033DEE207
MPFTRSEFTKQSALTGAGIALTGTVAALATARKAPSSTTVRSGSTTRSAAR